MTTNDVSKEQIENTHIENALETIDISRITNEERRKVIRKLDFHLIPLLFALYTFSVLDKSNLGNAKLVGLAKDIDLSGGKYNLLRVMF